ncbi:tetratricopeptide repeat protein [Phormidium sp. FACHB-1136]|uniref:CHAT domain-containing protein n=1 Tax=Phormidium sp. FACHB-1136 TaxID=2692848 RepID=UPI001684F84B|nr:tetratricopeptide repeat protein [Phormidium sp. FACHB-1136]MBD2428878.1 tetratricopeptide repeat protein [Phormidium sp. FACHB-1136]
MRLSWKWLWLLVALGLPLAPGGLTMPLPAIAQTAPNEAQSAEADRLFQQGIQQYDASQFRDASQSWQAALELYRAVGNRAGEGHVLGNLGIAYSHLGQPLKALDCHQQRLAIVRESGDREREVDTLGNLGNVYNDLGQHSQALDYYQQGLALAREIGDHQGEASALGNLGNVYSDLGQYRDAIDFYQRSMNLARESDNRAAERAALGNIGIAYHDLGQYAQAIIYHQQQLVMAREDRNRYEESNALGNLGSDYYGLGRYPQAMDYYQQSLALARSIEDRDGEANAIGNLGHVYRSLGQYSQALNAYQQHLTLAREMDNRTEEAHALGNLGLVYRHLGQYTQAIEALQQRLAVAQEMEDRVGEGAALGNLGNVYYVLEDYGQAINYHQRHLTIAREIINSQGVINALCNLGNAYYQLEDYPQAISVYQQSLALARTIGDRAGEGRALNNLGIVYGDLNQPELAIIFLKEAVNSYETIRTNNRALAQSLQDSYTETVADTYRSLTNLLLDQGRILEAQQVLELLKVEELRKFTRAHYSGGTLTYDPVEQPVVEAHGSLIALGVAISECDPNCPQTLYDQQMALERQYDQTVASFEQTVRQRRASDRVFYDPTSLSSDALDLVNAQPGTVLIYPVVLEDRLWLLWTATGGVVGSVEVAVSQAELSRAVVRFRELLERQDAQAYDEFKVVSQQLYGWLIAPLEAELEKNRIRQLIFAQDHTTRYLPMAALYDGSQYLLERYTISTVLSAALTDTQGRLGDVASVSALGLGLTQPIPGFNALPNVAQELREAIRESNNDDRGIFPGQIFLDEAFTFDALSQNVRWANILHIATHAEFVPSTQGESYILSGTGQRLALADIGALDAQLRNLHLVILSACETALGGSALDGTEIAGVSSYFLGRNKAETVMATLWQVDDAGTSLLMQRFYALLSTGELTKAEALRQAQLSLLKGEASLDNRMDTLGIRRGFELAEPEESSVGLAHPYYWAPFILIGNGL